jgi:hypothetical protein
MDKGARRFMVRRPLFFSGSAWLLRFALVVAVLLLTPQT